MAIEQRTTGQPDGEGSEQKTDVLLVNMPFGILFQPSAGLGSLKAALTARGVSAKILHLTLQFAELITPGLYARLSRGLFAPYDLVGEWIFAASLFDSARLDSEGYIENVLRGHSPAHRGAYYYTREPSLEISVRDILDARAKVESYLDECLAEVLSHPPRIVGFTSVFQQQVASLALAKRIKAHAPQTCVVFGGANCEAVMGAEVVRQFPFVDAVVSGEGEVIFPKLVRRILDGEPFSDLQGVYAHDNLDLLSSQDRYPNAPSVVDVDDLPYPNYDDFFQQLETSSLNGTHPTKVPFQTSRGCWWGERSQCTFCGLNGAAMAYRSKSAERALDELLHLTSEYTGSMVQVVDNILNMKYFQDFIPRLAELQLDVELFYEVKANLSKDQVRLLRDAGITRIQPGIESLSDTVLKLMRKGVTALRNIQLLKWCKELGISVGWNMLWGFPGESPDEYAHMKDLIPLLTHLQPPDRAGAVRLDRFSPNFECSAQLGFVDVAPFPAYRYVYPFDPEAVANLAYYFTFEYREPRDVEAYTKPVLEAVVSWQVIHKESELLLGDKDPHTPLLIWDLRPIAQDLLTVLAGLQRALYLACDGIRTVRQLRQVAEQHSGETVSEREIEKLLQPLVEAKLMLRVGNSYLSLAVPLGEYLPRSSVLERVEALR